MIEQKGQVRDQKPQRNSKHVNILHTKIQLLQLYHPNVDRSGDLCIPILCFDNWKPATTLGDILTSVLLILGEPDLSRAIRIEIADEFVNSDTTAQLSKPRLVPGE
ncbi:ubiquitin--protein ligase [Dictyocaulus viviparus]|uniref:Ubiquitin--protein ligase n=1 Tax=Dictyocaulus viviparus TaxID=29172 RepID=A0A0D8XZX2_DICVI|nr:ubiquitin--protein ligase [Dictyocaulus viviparus]